MNIKQCQGDQGLTYYFILQCENIKSKITYSFLEYKVIDDYNAKLLKKENQNLNIREPFISSDDSENYDINNFKWKKSIKEKLNDRYAISKRWQTSFAPNPNLNNSCYNWRKKNALSRPRNNQEHVYPDEPSTCHINEIYNKKSDALLKEFKKRHFSNLSRSKENQCSVSSSSSSSLASENEDRVIYQEKFQNMNNARNEIQKILNYYSGYLRSTNKNGNTFNPENIFFLKNLEVKQWFERDEIMDRTDDLSIL